MRNFDEILAKIARDNGTTPEDVLHEMQVAIDNVKQKTEYLSI